MDLRRTPTSFVAACLSVLLGVSAAGASSATTATIDARLAEVASDVREATARADAIEAVAREGSLGELIAVLTGTEAPTFPATSSGSPVRDLVATVRAAERTIAIARGDSSPSMSGLLRAQSEVHAVASREAVPEPRLLDRPATEDELAAAEVDVDAIVGAGLDVAAAIDRALPTLLSSSSTSSSEAAAPCEVVDQPPVLCVGGTGSDAHTSAYRVIIDQGGDDSYALRYADRYFTSDPAGPNPVQVVVDLSGNDSYQGAGYGFGGVGLTVDVTGNDRYREAIYRYQGNDADPAHSYGSGFGALGLGGLLDLQGADEYSLTGRSDGGEVQIFGQGAGMDGVGVLADRGTEADRWTVTAERGAPQSPNDEGAQTGIGAQAYATAASARGTSLLFDEGGDAVLSVDAVTPAGSTAAAYAQGYAAMSNSFLLSGVGTTTYRVDMRGGRKADVYPWAQAFGNTVLRDSGGDDTYSVTATVEGEVVETADDGCECGDVGATNAYNPFALGGWANGQAVSGAVLYDAGGNDSYGVSSRITNTARAFDRRAEGQVASARAATPHLTTATGQGVGGHLLDRGGNDLYSLELITEAAAHATGGGRNEAIAHGGILQLVGQGTNGGSLVDLAGSNTYRAVTRSDATATPTSHLAYGGITDLRARGMRGGVFSDGGSTSTFVAEPNVGALVGSYEAPSGDPTGTTWSTPFMLVSQRIDADEASSPPVIDPRELGLGRSDGLGTKAPTSIEFDQTGTYDVKPGRNDVSVRLTGPGGAPVAGERVLLEVEAIAGCLPPDVPFPPSTPCPYLDDAAEATRHTPLFQLHAVTDQNGVAEVSFDPAGLDPDIRNGYAPFSSFTQYPRPKDLVLVALYSGDAGRAFSLDTLDLRLP